MSINVEKLHEQLISMSLGDLLLLAGQAVNMGMPKEKTVLILKYVDIAIVKYRLDKAPSATAQRGEK